jgi:hypothetical protein
MIQELGVFPDCDDDSGILYESSQFHVKINQEKRQVAPERSDLP